MMRVTQSMLSNNMMYNLSQSFTQMDKYQDQLASGMKINRPSDDPIIAMKGVMYRRNLGEVEQYQRNFSAVHAWIDGSDSALDLAAVALQRVRELVVQAANDGGQTDDERQAISQEISQLKDHLVNIANTQVGDQYIFNGTNTVQAPFNPDGTPTGDENTQELNVEIANNVYLNVNSNTAVTVFGFSDGDAGSGIFGALDQIIETLTAIPSLGADIGDQLPNLDKNINEILNLRSDIGSRSNRSDLMEDRMNEMEVITNRIMSDNEDAEVDKVITDLKTQETIHRAALGVGARVIQPSLLDFLR